MRLPEGYRDTIRQEFEAVFGNGEVYLFGSRTDDTRRGGDIDLYLIPEVTDELFQKKLRFRARLFRELGEQKIDIVFARDPDRLIEQEARQWGVRL
jgi:predicted nucleotidyltransferase